MTRTHYPVTYLLERHDPPISIEECRARGLGGCDRLRLTVAKRPPWIFTSIIGTPGEVEQLSTLTMTVAGKGPLADDGRWPELTPAQRCQIWSIMAHGLVEQLDEEDPRALICRFVVEATRSAVLGRNLLEEDHREAQRLLGEVGRILLGGHG